MIPPAGKRRTLQIFASIAVPLSLLMGCQAGDAPEPEGEEVASDSDSLYVASTVLWRLSGPIPVCWENPSASNETQRGWVRDAVLNTWEAYSTVSFSGWGGCTPTSSGIRIVIADGHPHVVALGNGLDGVQNGMLLNFTFENWGTSCKTTKEHCIRSVAVHEFGHALGFSHEQNRADTPASLCDEAPQGTNGDRTPTPWDVDSVMNYCNPTWNNAGNLSAHDIQGAQRYYGGWPSSAVAGDWNGDGRSDVFFHNPVDNMPFVAIADAAGSLNRVPTDASNFDFYDYTKALVLDHNNDGKDDLLLYQPGSGHAHLMLSHGDGRFGYIYNSYPGLAGFDLYNGLDSALRLDFNGDGYDDLFFYRPGGGRVTVARSHGNGTYTAAYASSWGIAGYDFMESVDRALVLDYNGDGKDDLFFYRPGHGAAYVARSNGDGSFTQVYASHGGIAGYDLFDPKDQVLVFDYNGDGKDDLLLYRPGHGVAYVGRSNGDGSFTTVYASGGGIATYDLFDSRDRAVRLDHDGDGRDDLLLYRPGGGATYVARSVGNGSFTLAYASMSGAGGFSPVLDSDKVISLDANGDQKSDLLWVRTSASAGRAAISSGAGWFSAGSCVTGYNVSCPL